MDRSLESVTTATLALALDAASLRQQALAENIANVDTAGYVRQGVDFASEVEALRRELDSGRTVSEFALAAVRLEVKPQYDVAGRAVPVQLDAEMAALSENTLQYQALAKGLSRHLGLLYTAASDGRK